MTAEKAFELLSQLLTCCGQVTWQGDGRSFVTTVTKATGSLKLTTGLQEADFVFTFSDSRVQADSDQLRVRNIPIGTTIIIQVPTTTTRLWIAKNLEGLLRYDSARKNEPESYIIIPEGSGPFLFLKGGDLSQLPAEFIQYHKAVRLWALLERTSHHRNSNDDSLLFFGSRRIEISPIYFAKDLQKPIMVEAIEKFVEGSDQEEVRREIFLSVLSDLLRDQGCDTSFRLLLSRTGIIAQRLREGLSVFLATKSPVKLLEEARKESLSLSEKLEKIVSGLELKGLAVPAAILLAIKDLERGLGFTPLNDVILGSTLLFSITMCLVFRSQAALITPLRKLITKTRNDFAERGLEQTNPDLTALFQSLLDRLSNVVKASVVVLILSWVPLIAVCVVMFAPSPNPSTVPQTSASPPPFAPPPLPQTSGGH